MATKSEGTRKGNRTATKSEGTRNGNRTATKSEGTRNGNRTATKSEYKKLDYYYCRTIIISVLGNKEVIVISLGRTVQ
jgi:hypothetical protein